MTDDTHPYKVRYHEEDWSEFEYEMTTWLWHQMGFPDNAGIAGNFMGEQFNDRWSIKYQENVVAFRDKEDAALFMMFFDNTLRS